MMREAFAWVVVSRVALIALPFRRVARHLGSPGAASVAAPVPADPAVVEAVGRAVHRASRVAPFAASCMAQAMAGQQMLRQRGTGSTIRMGLDRHGDSMYAHAWLACGDVTVTGGGSMDDFTAVASFTQRP